MPSSLLPAAGRSSPRSSCLWLRELWKGRRRVAQAGHATVPAEDDEAHALTCGICDEVATATVSSRLARIVKGKRGLIIRSRLTHLLGPSWSSSGIILAARRKDLVCIGAEGGAGVGAEASRGRAWLSPCGVMSRLGSLIKVRGHTSDPILPSLPHLTTYPLPLSTHRPSACRNYYRPSFRRSWPARPSTIIAKHTMMIGKRFIPAMKSSSVSNGPGG